jgi:hypothetical protein
MDKMKFETPDGTAINIEKIAELFPAAVTGGKVNFDLLRTLLGDDVAGDEAYEFAWVGKRAAIAEAGRPIRKTLRPCREEGRDWDSTENLYIEGDNLDVLKLLQESYLGKVKMIYIDLHRITPATTLFTATILPRAARTTTRMPAFTMKTATVYIATPRATDASTPTGAV